MTNEQRMDLCKDHLAAKTEDDKKAIYQTYGIEQLRMPAEEAIDFAAQMLHHNPERYHKYRDFNEMVNFCFWYYKCYMSHPFPNGFDNWHKSYYHIVEFIIYEELLGKEGLLKRIRETEGTNGLMRLAKEWTEEFENQYNDLDWKDKDAYQTINKFCEQKKQEPSSYNTLEEYLGNDRQHVGFIVDDMEEAVKENNKLHLYLFHPRLSVYKGTGITDLELHTGTSDLFLTRHGASPFVKEIKSDPWYRAIAVSILCDDKNIIIDLDRLYGKGTLL